MKIKVGIIGGGNMGAAIMASVQDKYSVNVCEADKNRCQYLKSKYKVAINHLRNVVVQSEIIILAVKPQSFEALLQEVRELEIEGKVFISIAAGITTQYIEKRLGSKTRVIRVMPNLPAQVGQGITAVCKGKYSRMADTSIACEIFSSIGSVVIVEEKWMDAVTAVSGSGPAYVFLFAEIFKKAARSLGLNEGLSQLLVQQTLKGSLQLLEQSKEDPGTLRERVTSKGGTTQAAMDVLTGKKIDKIFKEALAAAKKRAMELSK